MVRWSSFLLLGACGRLGFDGAPDARPARYAPAVLADHPVAYFRLDGAAPTAIDASGNGHDSPYILDDRGATTPALSGALVDDADTATELDADGVTGDAGQAWIFTPSLRPVFAGDFSVELFYKPIATSIVDRSFFVCEEYLVDGFRTGLGPDGLPKLWTDAGGATSAVVSTLGSATAEQWLHFVVTRAGASVRMYVDGALAASDDTFDYIVPDPDAPCGFGAFHGMPGHGVFDEVAVYDTVLTAEQVAAHVAAAR